MNIFKKLFKVIKIVIEDKRKGCLERDNRVREINDLLGLNKYYYTEKILSSKSDKQYMVEYTRGKFYFDDTPITIKNIIKNFTFWHVTHWCVFPNGGRVASRNIGKIVYGIFSKKEIYDFLEHESDRVDGVLRKN